jgi:hypothetical protein
MHSEVLKLLSTYLEALPAQVNTWDRKVVEYLSRNTSIYQEFKSGNDATRWGIYAGIKYKNAPH